MNQKVDEELPSVFLDDSAILPFSLVESNQKLGSNSNDEVLCISNHTLKPLINNQVYKKKKRKFKNINKSKNEIISNRSVSSFENGLSSLARENSRIYNVSYLTKTSYFNQPDLIKVNEKHFFSNKDVTIKQFSTKEYQIPDYDLHSQIDQLRDENQSHSPKVLTKTKNLSKMGENLKDTLVVVDDKISNEIENNLTQDFSNVSPTSFNLVQNSKKQNNFFNLNAKTCVSILLILLTLFFILIGLVFLLIYGIGF
jgi:hypothetical protein